MALCPLIHTDLVKTALTENVNLNVGCFKCRFCSIFFSFNNQALSFIKIKVVTTYLFAGVSKLSETLQAKTSRPMTGCWRTRNRQPACRNFPLPCSESPLKTLPLPGPGWKSSYKLFLEALFICCWYFPTCLVFKWQTS